MIRQLWSIPQVLLLCTMTFWAGNTVLGRAIGPVVPPLGLAFWRWSVAAIILLALFHGAVKRDWPVIRTNWRMILLLSFLSVGCYNTFVYIALQSTPALNVLLVMSAMPALITFAGFVLYGDRPTPLQLASGAISMAGAAIIILRGELDWQINPGDGWVLLAACCWSLYTALLRHKPVGISASGFVTITFALGPLMLAPFYAAETLHGQPVPFADWRALAAIGYVGIFPSILAYFCYNRGVELMGATRAGQFIHLMPLIGAAMAITLLGESFRWFHMAGGGLIIIGLLIAERGRPRPAA